MPCKALLAVLAFAAFPAMACEPCGTLADHALDPAAVALDTSSPADEPPKLVSGKAPIYPISMLLSGIDGRCEIEFTVGTDGKAKDFVVLSRRSKFADHAIIAVSAWVFEPARRNGIPVEARVRKAFSYAAK